jgi:hypothetical protein
VARPTVPVALVKTGNKYHPPSGAHRKVCREALTGAHAGWVSSFERCVLERRRYQASVRQHGRVERGETPDGSTGVGDPKHAWKLNAREVLVAPTAVRKQWAGRGTPKGNPFVHDIGKSDFREVPGKAPNKDRKFCGARRL